jgi:hypothetical protein
MRRLTLTLAVLVAAAVAAPAADASSRQVMIMQDDAQVRANPSATVAEMAGYGADVVKINLYWDEVEATRGSFNWGSYDAAVNAIVDAGLQPYLSIGGHAPKWATGKHGRPGTNRPNAKAFKQFAQVAGRHYSSVHIWSIWNEPNLYSWLSPQRSHGIPLSPSIYRNLYLAGYRGLKAGGHTGDKFLLGELMPRGGSSQQKVRPLEFLREMACLDSHYRQIRGKAAKKRGCRKVGRFPTSGIAYHPYTPPAGPHTREGTDDAAIGQLGRLRATIDALARRGKLPRHLPIWISELGFQTKPPDKIFGAPLKRAASFMDESEWIAFRNPRVASYSQYTLYDDPPRSGPGPLRWSSWQAGIYYRNGKRKPYVFNAFRLPVHVRRLGGNRVEILAGRRIPGETATVAAKAPGGSYKTIGTVAVNSAGYFKRIFKVQSATRSKFKVTIDGVSRVK